MQDSVVLFANVEEAVCFLDEEVHPQQLPVAGTTPQLRAKVLQLSLELEFPEIESWERLFVSAEGFDQRLLMVIDTLCREHLLGWPLLESLGDVARGEGPAEMPTRVLDSSVFGTHEGNGCSMICGCAHGVHMEGHHPLQQRIVDTVHTRTPVLVSPCSPPVWVFHAVASITINNTDELAPEELQAEGYEVLCLRCEALLGEYPTSLEQDARALQQLRGKEVDEQTRRTQLALRYRSNKKRVLLNAIQHMRSM